MKYYVGIDLGGTNIVAGIVNEECKVLNKAKTKTNCPRPAQEIVADMVAVVKQAVSDAGLTMDDIEWVGVGCPGTVNRDNGMIIYANNLEFYDLPMGGMLSEALGKKIYMDNDANAAAYGEFVAGAAKGTNNAVAITLGTGVGSGIIIDGKIYSGFNFAGAEIGHSVIVKDGRHCTCGRDGCFEAYCSASALIAFTKEKMNQTKDTIMWEICDGDINRVNGLTAFDAMRADDKAGKEVVDLYLSYLSTGVVNIVNIFQPEVLCIGGGVSKEGENLIGPIREALVKENYARFGKQQTKVVTAELSNDAGVIGAAMLGQMDR